MDIQNFLKISDVNELVDTCLQGLMSIHYETATHVLGEPHRGQAEDGKSSYNWAFIVHGEKVTCYYRTDDSTDERALCRMHVGGHSLCAPFFVALLFDLKTCEWKPAMTPTTTRNFEAINGFMYME